MLMTQLSCIAIDDIPAVEELERALGLSGWGGETYRKFLREFPEYFGSKALVRAEVDRYRFAGFVLARSIFENLEILKVGVNQEYHRCGIGTLLMTAAYSEGRKRGCLRCFLEVRKSNAAAIGFYHAHRFTVAGIRRNYYSNPVEDALIMERSF